MIFSIKPFEIHDGDGIRTTVFFKGCPLRCKWCHNPESFSPRPDLLYDAARCVHCLRCTAICETNRVQDGRHVLDRSACTLCGKCENVCRSGALELLGRRYDACALVEELMRDEIFMKGSGGGVTFSGGEPLMYADFCLEVASQLRKRGIHVAVDSSAYAPRRTLEKIMDVTDLFLFDVKAIDEETHIRCTGVSNREILENIRYVDEKGIPMEIRYPYVPGWNAQEAEAVARFVSGLRTKPLLRLLPYHSYAAHKYACLGMEYPLSDLPMPTQEETREVLERMNRYTKTATFD